MAVLIKKIAALGLLMTLLLSATSVHAAVFYPEHYVLANGVQLVIVKNKLGTAAGHMVWYKVGALDEVQGKTGIAHYLEHMMFKGTDKVPTGVFHKVIAAKGGEENAFTSYDYTAYHEVIAADHLGMVMQMEADRMRGLKFTDEQAAQEKSVVLSERQQRTENSPNGLFLEKLRAALFLDHPYGRPVIGLRSDIEKLSSKDLRDFYKKHYAPSRAIVIVSGNVESKDVLRLAAGTYGRIPTGTPSTIVTFPKIKKPVQAELSYEDSRVTQPYATRQIIVPSFKDQPKTATALEVLAEILNAEVGLLHRAFVQGKQNASGLSVSYDGMKRGPSTFSISSSPSPGECVHEVEGEVFTYLKELARTGVPGAQVAAAKQRLLDSAIFARDKLMAPAQIIGGALAVGLPLSSIESWPRHIREVTTQQVNLALLELMVNPHQIVGFLTPKLGGKS